MDRHTLVTKKRQMEEVRRTLSESLADITEKIAEMDKAILETMTPGERFTADDVLVCRERGRQHPRRVNHEKLAEYIEDLPDAVKLKIEYYPKYEGGVADLEADLGKGIATQYITNLGYGPDRLVIKPIGEDVDPAIEF